MSKKQYSFINGIIRKHRPKNCLEVGVAQGGSSVLILNAIKDINGAKLISLDLNNNFYLDPNYKTGYRVTRFFESRGFLQGFHCFFERKWSHK